MAAVLRIFHISDLHARGFDSPQQQRAEREASRWERVLGEPWRANLAELRKDGPIDLVAFTGDLADWGHESDFARGIELLRRTCAELEVPLDRLFVVPGNHDVARQVEAEAWSELRRVALEAPDEVSRWMADVTRRPRGIPEGAHERVLARTAAFWRAVRDGLGRDLGPSADTHGRLGYRHTLALERFPQPVHVIGLDSAWLAGDDADAGKLLLTEDQVLLLTHDRRGRLVEGVRIGLVHHPLGDLASGDRARLRLPECVDLLLRGHQHEPTSTTLVQPDRRLHELAAGSMFEGDLSDRYRNACQLIELTIDRPGKPIDVDVRFRGWSTGGGFWHDDASLYRTATRGRLRFTIDPTPPQVHTSPPPSPVKTPTSDPLARYHQMSTVHRGLYSEVRKCKSRETGALCVVKRTRADLVSLEALERLQALRDPHVVAPTRFWRADGFVWEELPYIGGLRLSDAVGHGCGGLSGPVLRELVLDLSGILDRIHGAGVIHRDIHPDNIYMMTNSVGRRVASHDDDDRRVYGVQRSEEPRRTSMVPVEVRSPPFSITWYLVDNTFAICDHEASARPPSSHDTFTAEEQVQGLPSRASDYYSFGATLYYCILGIEVPSPAQRRRRSTPLRVPRGSHPSIDFDELMTSLLSLEPEQRRLFGVYKQSTVTPGFTGLIRSSDRQMLAIDQFESYSHGFGLERAPTIVDSLVRVWGDGEIPDLFAPHDPFDDWETEFVRVGLRRWREHLRELGSG